MSSRLTVAIDRGGTFTDVLGECNGERVMLKLLSVDSHYADAPTEAIRRLINHFFAIDTPRSQPVDGSYIATIRMGTTVATNALLERRGDRMALAITKGFRDLLYIGNQSRPALFDLSIASPDVLYESVLEVTERLILDPNGTCEGTTGERLSVHTPLDEAALRDGLVRIFDTGIRSLAIVFLHAYMFPAHELRAREIALGVGFTHVSLSHEAMPMVKIVPRGYTACADAYLTPCIRQYIKSFLAGFVNLDPKQVLVMQSDGGLAESSRFTGCRAILSGPAGGVVGYAKTVIIDCPTFQSYLILFSSTVV